MSRHITLLGAFALALTFTACGDDTTTEDTTTPSTTASSTTAPATTAPADLTSQLLTVEDVGETWQLGNPVNELDFGDVLQLPCPDVVVNPSAMEGLTGDAGVQFEPADGSYQLLMEVLTVGDDAQLASHVRAYFSAWSVCLADPPEGTVAEPLDIPTLGDQQMAFRGTNEVPDEGIWLARSAMVQVGGSFVMLNLIEVVPSVDATPTVSDEEFVGILETAISKIDA